MTGPTYDDRSGAPIPPEPGGDPYRAPAGDGSGNPYRAPAAEPGTVRGPEERLVPPGRVPERTG